MVKIPQPVQQGQQVGSVQTQPANTPFMSVSPADTSSGARDMMALGGAVVSGARFLEQRNQENMLKEAGLRVDAWERQQYDPQTGMLRDIGRDAIGATQRATDSFNQMRAELESAYGSGQVSPSGQRALAGYLDGTSQRVWGKAAAHETSQSAAYATTLLQAEIEGAVDGVAMAYGDPDAQTSAMIRLDTTANDLADDQGLFGAARAQLVQDYKSEAALRTVANVARDVGAIEGVALLEQGVENGDIDASVAAGILDKLQPLAESEKGAALAQMVIEAGKGPVGMSNSPDPVEFGTRFHAAMSTSESSGDFRASNDAVGSSDRVGHFGRQQFSRDRIDDAINAGVLPEGTTGEMLIAVGPDGEITEAAKQMQITLEKWHWNDIDAHIKKRGYDKLGFSVDGMRAVAHIGGKGGLDEFVKGEGRGIEDTNNTSRLDYYEKFAGGGISGDGIMSSEQNPRVRAEAAELLVAHEKAVAARFKRVQTEATNGLFAAIAESYGPDGDGDFDLNQVLRQKPELLDQLGTNITQVRDYYSDQRTGREVVTDITARDTLQRQAVVDPSAFMAVDLSQYASKIARGDLDPIKALQNDLIKEKSEETGVYGGKTVSQLNSFFEEVTGFKSSENINGKTQFRNAVRDFTAANGQAPTETQQIAMASNFAYDATGTTRIVDNYDIKWRWDADEGNVSSMFESMNAGGIDAFLRDTTELVMNITDANGTVTRTVITPEERNNFASQYRQYVGRLPKPSSLVMLMYLSKGGIE